MQGRRRCLVTDDCILDGWGGAHIQEYLHPMVSLMCRGINYNLNTKLAQLVREIFHLKHLLLSASNGFLFLINAI